MLFIFPSRYLFAIGFPPIFSIRWNLPPIWAAIPSNSTPRTHSISFIHKYERGYHPPWRTFPDHLIRVRPMDACSSDHIPEGFQPVLFPLHSPLLGKSLLVSFPPLSYMLKFSGYSYLIGGPNIMWGYHHHPSFHYFLLCLLFSLLMCPIKITMSSHSTKRASRKKALVGSLDI